MNHYHVRIDGEQSTGSYTYKELVDMGLFELDADSLNGIEVKKSTVSDFTPFKLYSFPERQSNDNPYYIDEYGQIHRRNTIPRSVDNGSGASVPANSASAGSASSGSSNNSGDILWRIIITILVLAIGIPILANIGLDGFWGCVVFIIGFVIIVSVWDCWDYI